MVPRGGNCGELSGREARTRGVTAWPGTVPHFKKGSKPVKTSELFAIVKVFDGKRSTVRLRRMHAVDESKKRKKKAVFVNRTRHLMILRRTLYHSCYTGKMAPGEICKFDLSSFGVSPTSKTAAFMKVITTSAPVPLAVAIMLGLWCFAAR